MEIKEIGRVQNDCEFPLDHFRKCEKESHIVIIDDFVEGLYGIDEWNHLQVIFGSPSSGEYWHKCLTDCGDSRSFLPRERPGGDGLPLGSARKTSWPRKPCPKVWGKVSVWCVRKGPFTRSKDRAS